MTPEEQRAWIMKYDDPPSCPHGIMIGCRVCADANASPAEGEVTTGEAVSDKELMRILRDADGGEALSVRLRPLYDTVWKDGIDIEQPSYLYKTLARRIAKSENASLRAKLDERERKVESLRAECGLRQIQGYWEGADRTLKAMRKYLTHDQTCPEYMNGTIAKCTCGLRDAIDAARQSAIEQSRNVEGSRMRIYCCRVYDKDHGEMLSWHSNRAEAELALGEGRRQSNSGDVTLCIIPTTRKGLIQWLNANFTTNNG